YHCGLGGQALGKLPRGLALGQPLDTLLHEVEIRHFSTGCDRSKSEGEQHGSLPVSLQGLAKAVARPAQRLPRLLPLFDCQSEAPQEDEIRFSFRKPAAGRYFLQEARLLKPGGEVGSSRRMAHPFRHELLHAVAAGTPAPHGEEGRLEPIEKDAVAPPELHLEDIALITTDLMLREE